MRDCPQHIHIHDMIHNHTHTVTARRHTRAHPPPPNRTAGIYACARSYILPASKQASIFLLVGGPVGENDDVRASDSVERMYVSSIEELDTRSMSYMRSHGAYLTSSDSHSKNANLFLRRHEEPGSWVGRANWPDERRTSRNRCRIDGIASLV